MAITPLVVFMTLIGNHLATHCDKELDYHDNYGYGIDITCEDLSNENEKMLKSVSVSNELVLNIKNSNLTKVTPELFSNVPKIKYLSIENSTFSFDPNEEVFANFVQLEHLTVKNTQFNNLNSQVLKGLDHLKELSLINCNLKIIRNGTFKMLQNLETLKLSRNHFRNMFSIPFCELPSLKFLDLRHNEIQNIEENFLVCFEKGEESNFQLNGHSFEVKYHKDDFYHQTKPTFNLLVLDLSHNEITNVGYFDWALSLKHLNLSNNMLRNITRKVLTMLQDLERLSLQNNLLDMIDDEALTLKNLKSVNFENNTLSEVSLKNLFNLEEVNLSRNKLTSMSLTQLRNLTNLKKLFLHDNEIRGLFEETFLNFTSLEVLDLSNNALVLKSESFKNALNLKKLVIRNNSLENIPISIFNKLKKLEHLDISENRLRPFLDRDTFLGLDNLEVLNISHNLIESLSYDLLKPLCNLQVLDISGNRLQNFQIALVSSLPSLRVINIKSNLLSCSTLSAIITFLKSKDISYTINEEFEYDRQNVEGIYCEEMASRMLVKNENGGMGALGVLGILILVVSSSVVVSFAFYKCLMFTKRRGYTNDELELL